MVLEHCVCTPQLVEALPFLFEKIGVRCEEKAMELSDAERESFVTSYDIGEANGFLSIIVDRRDADAMDITVMSTEIDGGLNVLDMLKMAGATDFGSFDFSRFRFLRLSVDSAQNWPNLIAGMQVRIKSSWPESDSANYRFLRGTVRLRRRSCWVNSGVSISVPDRRLFGYMKLQLQPSFWNSKPRDENFEPIITHFQSCLGNETSCGL